MPDVTRMPGGDCVAVEAQDSAETISPFSEKPDQGGFPRGTKSRATGPSSRRPRLGFLGVGWIGRHRLDAVARSGLAEIVTVADYDSSAAASAAEIARARVGRSLEDLVKMDLDGVVIATPTALHAEQAISALDAGVAVFCQKPLGRTAAETRRVIEAARRANRLLGVDMSYRFVRGIQKIYELVRSGTIGSVYAVDLVFHNAYGPDKRWYYDPLLSGGGCVIDLGIHLFDLALWMLDFPQVTEVSSRLFAQGRALRPGEPGLEDYAVARVDFAGGVTATVSCSWRLAAGRDAVIRAAFYGTEGGLALRNEQGSFYDFRAEHFVGTSRTVLDQPPDEWGGRAAVAWVTQLCGGQQYDPAIEGAADVAAIIDQVYGREA